MERVGVIGTGNLGRPMATTLLRAGFPVAVTNRSRPAVAALVAAGATGANSPRAVADASDIVITCVPTAADVESVLEGEAGVFAALRPDHILVEMSTIAPVDVRDFAARTAERGATFLDAPVSGGAIAAANGTLSIMVGGDMAAYERCLPVFAALGTTVEHMGPSGAGQTAKACNQIVSAVNLRGLSEALVLGAKAGIAPEKLLAVFGGGLAGSRVLEVYGPQMIRHDFTPGGKAALHSKDLGIVLALARELRVPLPATALAAQALLALDATGHGDLAHSALLLVAEQLAGHAVSDEPITPAPR